MKTFRACSPNQIHQEFPAVKPEPGQNPADKQKMARRRKGLDTTDFIGPVVAIGFLAMLVPGGQAIVQSVIGWVIWIGIFVVTFVVVLGVAVFLKRSRGGSSQEATSPPAVFESTRIQHQTTSQSSPRIEEQLRTIDWFQFEKLIALAYSGTGTVTRKGGANPDGGIDLIVERQGEQVGVQCKHWRSWTVGVKVVREMIGALADAGLKKGIIVSLNPYSQDAVDLAARHNIELVDEQGVVDLIKYLDQRDVQSILGDTRKVCPKCEREMVLRTATKGRNEGGQFWGCSGYPRCKFILPAR